MGHSGSEPDPLRCQDLNRSAKGCEPVGLPKVANQLDGQRLQQFRPNCCILSLGSNLLVPPGALYIALRILNYNTHQVNNSLSFYLSSEAEASLRSELGSRFSKRLPARSGKTVTRFPKRLPKKILQNSF